MKQIASDRSSTTSKATDSRNLQKQGRQRFLKAGVAALFYCLGLCFAPAPAVHANATVNGLSGTMIVPGLDVLSPGGARAAIHMVGETEFNEATFKGVFAFSDDSEVAIVKRFAIRGKAEQTEPMFAGKYKVRPNMAVAAVLDPNEGYQDSVMLLTGMPGNRVVLGLGTNIAMNPDEKKASFGRYSQKSAEVDPVFFIMGASLNLDIDTKLTIDYSGNDFVLGLRHAFDEALSLDFGLYTPSRIYDRHRFIVGANFGF